MIGVSPSGTFGPSFGNIGSSGAPNPVPAAATQSEVTSATANARGGVGAVMMTSYQCGMRNAECGIGNRSLNSAFRITRSLLHVAGDVDGPLAVHLGHRPGHFHHVGHVVDRGLAEVGQP